MRALANESQRRRVGVSTNFHEHDLKTSDSDIPSQIAPTPACTPHTHPASPLATHVQVASPHPNRSLIAPNPQRNRWCVDTEPTYPLPAHITHSARTRPVHTRGPRRPRRVYGQRTPHYARPACIAQCVHCTRTDPAVPLCTIHRSCTPSACKAHSLLCSSPSDPWRPRAPKSLA